jgi:hypothetical protein
MTPEEYRKGPCMTTPWNNLEELVGEGLSVYIQRSEKCAYIGIVLAKKT